MFYNIHTHYHSSDPDVLCIENIYQNFDADISGRKVSLGLHPWYLDRESLKIQLVKLKENLGKPEVLAIGECGLDKIYRTDWALQRTAFQEQIRLAREFNKPLLIHCVKAFAEVLAELKAAAVPVIFHGINNKRSLVRPVIDAGYYLSFGKSLSSRNESILDTFRETPLEQLFLETDDVDTDIRKMYYLAARIKNIPEKDIVLQLEKNFSNLFNPNGGF